MPLLPLVRSGGRGPPRPAERPPVQSIPPSDSHDCLSSDANGGRRRNGARLYDLDHDNARLRGWVGRQAGQAIGDVRVDNFNRSGQQGAKRGGEGGDDDAWNRWTARPEPIVHAVVLRVQVAMAVVAGRARATARARTGVDGVVGRVPYTGTGCQTAQAWDPMDTPYRVASIVRSSWLVVISRWGSRTGNGPSPSRPSMSCRPVLHVPKHLGGQR